MPEKSVLIIDTDRETIEKIKSALESEGYLVFISSNKESGIATASKIPPSMIFISISIGATSGLEISKIIHETKALAHIPIVVITPHGATIEPRYTSVYGIVDFIKKPFTTEEVISKTIDILEMKQIDVSPHEAKDISKTVHDSPFEEEHSEANVTEEVEEESSRVTDEDLFPVQNVLGSRSPDDIENEIKLKTEDTKESLTKEPHSEQSQLDPTPHEEEPVKTTEKVTDKQEDDSVKSSEYLSPESKSDEIQKKIRILPIFIIILAVIGIIAGGSFIYTNYLEQPAMQQDTLIEPDQPIQQQATKDEQTPDNQIPPKIPEKNQPSPPPIEKAKTIDRKLYSVQIGAFKSEANAKTLSQKYKDKGHDVFIDKIASKEKGIVFKVLIGQFKNQEEATVFAQNLHKKEKINVMVIKR